MMPLAHRNLLRVVVLALTLQGCASAPPVPDAQSPSPSAAPAASRGPVVAQDDDLQVVVTQAGDDASALAARYLGDPGKGWWITQFNGIDRFSAGEWVVIPRKGPNPLGIGAQGYQTVPILSYHRFGSPKRRLSVTRADFEAQMEYLDRNGYRVISLAQFGAFLEGREALPPKSVVITIDDGYKSTYEIAYPVLRKYGFPATVFLYSDFVGAADAMTWSQMQEMVRSGLIDIQPHSKTHSNLALRFSNETPAQYRERVRLEVERPSALIGERLGTKAVVYAYPYGDVNETVVEQLQKTGLRLGVTVSPGGNPVFAYPFMVRRTMVFGTDDMETFKSRLITFNRTAAR